MEDAGGYEKVTAANLWPEIAKKMGYPAGKYAGTMKSNYEKLLLQYDLIVASKENAEKTKKKQQRQTSPSKKARTKEPTEEPPVMTKSLRKELDKLQFYGAGPKTALPMEDSPCNTRSRQQQQQQQQHEVLFDSQIT